MKKSIAIVSYSFNTGKIYKEQIESLKFTDVEVEAYCIGDEELIQGIAPDVLLVLSYDGYKKVEVFLENKPLVLFICRTISKLGYDQIMAIEAGTDVFLMDETKEMAVNMATVLMQLGVRHINVIPVDRIGVSHLQDSQIIVLGKQDLVNEEHNHIVDIGNSLIDMTTLIDVTESMDMHHLARNIDLKNN